MTQDMISSRARQLVDPEAAAMIVSCSCFLILADFIWLEYSVMDEGELVQSLIRG